MVLEERLQKARVVRAELHGEVRAAVQSAEENEQQLRHLERQLTRYSGMPDVHHLDLALYPRPPKGSRREVCQAFLLHTCSPSNGPALPALVCDAPGVAQAHRGDANVWVACSVLQRLHMHLRKLKPGVTWTLRAMRASGGGRLQCNKSFRRCSIRKRTRSASSRSATGGASNAWRSSAPGRLPGPPPPHSLMKSLTTILESALGE